MSWIFSNIVQNIKVNVLSKTLAKNRIFKNWKTFALLKHRIVLEVFIWRSRFIWRSGFICGGRDKIVFYKKPILWNVESGDNSVYKISKPCRLTRCNVEAYERTKANTCHLLYPVINQWSEETPFLSILRLNQGYLLLSRWTHDPTLPTALSLELAKSCQQVHFLPAIGLTNWWFFSGGSDSFPNSCLLELAKPCQQVPFFLHLSWLKLTWSI